MNWEKIKEFLQAIAGFALVFGVLYLIAYTPRTHERIKEQLFDEVIPKCARGIVEDLSDYDEKGNMYIEIRPGSGMNFSLEENLSECISENYPE